MRSVMIERPMTAAAGAALDAIEAVYDQGRYLDAFEELRRLGGPRAFTDPRGRVLAGRVLANLGAPRLSRLLILRAYRQARRDPHAAYYFSGVLADTAGVLAALLFLQRFGEPAQATPEMRALLLLRRASLLAILRDFTEAEALCRRAAAIWDHAWLWVERSNIELQADRAADALTSAARALELSPRYRPAIQQMASVLTSTGDRERAEALIAERSDGLQAPYVFIQLAQLRYDLERIPEARAAFTRAVEMMPWPEEATVRGLCTLAASIQFKLGDVQGSACFSRMTGHPAHQRLAARLEAGTPPRRVLLDVPYVRQDHKTCAPATLTSLCRYHRQPADHVSIVETICYDGTPAASERHWAEEHGFATRHFTVTWESAVALLDAGLPFALLTVDAGSAHLQAVVGYDRQRGSFLVRDPSVPALVEMDAEQVLADQRSAGPQGLALAPRAAQDRLAALALPDAGLHDRHYRLQRALFAHDRRAAEAELAALEAEAAGHVVTLQATRALAAYDNNQASLLVAFERLLEVQNDAPVPLLGRLSCLDGLARQDLRRQQLAEAAARPGTDPLFGRLWAEELARDGRHLALAEVWLWCGARRRPQDAHSYGLLADIAGRRGDLAGARELQRLAACLEDMNEPLALQYFRYARATGRTEEGLAFLRARADRLGRRAAGPWQTLHEALELLGQRKRAHELLEEALAARPDDGPLLVFAAGAVLRAGQAARARALLERAHGRVKETEWIRVAAELDRLEGARARALERWRGILATEPLSLEVHAAVASLLSETGERAAGREHLRAAAAAHAHHAGLARLLVGFTDDEGDEGLAVLRRVIDLAPTDAWARRELALRLARRHRIDEAMAEVEQAAALDAEAASTHGVRGFVLAAAGRRDPAREAFRQALARAADYVAAFEGLFEHADDAADQLRAIRFLQEELRRQVVYGESLNAWQNAARGLLPDEEVLAFLEEGRAARPELRGCWTAVIDQLLRMGRPDEAARTAREAVEQFPLVADALLVLASVEEKRHDRAAQRQALEQCLGVEPGHQAATRQLARLLEIEGDVDGACKLLGEAITREPLDPVNHGYLADVLAGARQVAAAFAAIRRALELQPGYEWAWDRLQEWEAAHGAADEALAVADAVVRARPEAAAAHLGRARLLMQRAGRLHDALEAFEEAIAHEPRLVDGHDQRAVLLARMERFDEALAACRPAAFGAATPISLRGRRAWVLAQQGRVDEAITDMEAVVQDSPAYTWGLCLLGEWYLARSHVHAARRAYERALAINPELDDAALGLFDVFLARDDLPGCERALAGPLRRHDDSPAVLARLVQLEAARGRRAAAEAAFVRLRALPQAGSWPMMEAARALAARGRGRTLRLVEGAMAEGAGSAGASASASAVTPDLLGEVWAMVASAGPALPRVFALRRLLALGRAGETAVATFVENLAEARRRVAVCLLLLRDRAALAATTRLWGAVGFALLTLGWIRWTARWMRDYRARPDAQPWMLNNLVVALRHRDRTAEAVAVSAQALTLPPDHVTDMHRRWLALDAAVAGRPDEAAAHLDRHLGPAGEAGNLIESYARALITLDTADGTPLPERKLKAWTLVTEAEERNASFLRSRLGQRIQRAALPRLHSAAPTSTAPSRPP